MPKKHILFVIPEYSHGGTNKSLENLLHFIDKSRYEVSVFCLYEDGVSYYKDLFAPYILRKSLVYTLAHDNRLTRKVMGLAMKLSSKINFDWLYMKEANRLQGKYHFDLVIAYQEGTATEFVSYIKDSEKIAFIHFDYAMLKDSQDLRATKQFYDKFQHITCVSQAALNSMLSVYPEYKSVSSYQYNTLNSQNIVSQAQQQTSVPYCDDTFNILSIGRFVDVKQFHLIPEIAKKIKQHSSRMFCWYIMGSGQMQDVITSEIERNRVNDVVRIIPAQDNPYTFLAKADLHVCTSSFESFSYTIAESKIVHTPVLCNNFPVAYEVINDSTGWICPINEMPQKIVDIINDKDSCYTQKKTSLAGYEYDNATIMSEFHQLLEKVTSC